MSMILALFSEKFASCKTLSIFLLMLKSAGTSCWDERHDFKIQTGWCVILKERRRKKKETCSFKRGGKKEKEKLWLRGTHDCTQRHTMTHHVVYRAVDSVVLFQQLFYCSGPGNYKPAASSSSSSLLVCFFFGRRDFYEVGSVWSRQALTWKLHRGFCFSLQRLFWPGHPTPWKKRQHNNTYRLFINRLNCVLTESAVHRVKPYLKVNWRWRIFWFYPDNTGLHFWRRAEIILPNLFGRETSTLRQEKKKTVNKCPCAKIWQRTLTFMRWSTRARSCVLMDSLQYSLSPGGATSRIANSLWNINTAHLNRHKTQIRC